jgi:gluconate kinase
MNLNNLPPNDLERLIAYQAHQDLEKRECERIAQKMEKGEDLTDHERVYWAYSPFGGANSHNY